MKFSPIGALSFKWRFVCLLLCLAWISAGSAVRSSRQRIKAIRFARGERSHSPSASFSSSTSKSTSNESHSDLDNQETTTDVVGGSSFHPWAAACPPLMRPHCSCSRSVYGNGNGSGYRDGGRKYNLVNCTNAGQNSSELLRHLPEDTEVLIFTGNHLQTLPKALFDPTKRYDQLHTVDLSDNAIEILKAKSFHNARSLKRLILNRNRLQIASANFQAKMFTNFEHLEELQLREAFALPESANSIDSLQSDQSSSDASSVISSSESSQLPQFAEHLGRLLAEAQLTHLKVLNLESNRIAEFATSFSLCPLPSLQKLYLAKNHLVDVQLNLTCTPKLRLIDLSDNRIRRLANRTLQLLEQSKPIFHVNLSGNPFHCDCGLLDLLRWLQRTRVWVLGRKSFTCASGYPASNGQQSLVQLPLERLQCDPNSAHLYGHRAPRSPLFVHAQQVLFGALLAVGGLLFVLLLLSGRGHVSGVWPRVRHLFGCRPDTTKHTLYSPLQKCQHVQTAGLPPGHAQTSLASGSGMTFVSQQLPSSANVPSSSSHMVHNLHHQHQLVSQAQRPHKARHPNKLNSVQRADLHEASI